MASICNRLLRVSVGQRAFLSLRNGSVITGTIIATFQNKVQIGFPLLVFNSAGTNVLAANTFTAGTAIPFIEIFCREIVAASTGNIALTASTASTIGGLV